MDGKPTIPGNLPALKASGRAFGMNLVTKPANLDLYRQYLPRSLDMPETPLVGVFHYEFPITNAHSLIPNGQYSESGIVLYCQRNGVPGWAEAAIFISWLGYIFGSLGGSRKVRIDQMALSPEEDCIHGCTIKGGQEIMDFYFAAKSMEQITREINPTPWQLTSLKGECYSPHLIESRLIISKVFKRAKILNLLPIIQDLSTQAGLINLNLAAGHPWSELLDKHTIAPGIFFDFKPDWSQFKL